MSIATRRRAVLRRFRDFCTTFVRKGLFTAHEPNQTPVLNTRRPCSNRSVHTGSPQTELNRTSRPSYTKRSLASRASASRLYIALIGCSETRSVSARSVLDTRIQMRPPFALEFADTSSEQFLCCERAYRSTNAFVQKLSSRPTAAE